MRIVQPLSDADLADIASAPETVTAAELARHLARPYFTVRHALIRIRRDGWICRLGWSDCLVCGEPVCGRGGSGRRLVHAACAQTRVNSRARQRRAENPAHTPSTSYVSAWRAEHPERNRELRERSKERMRQQWPERSAEDQAAILERAHQADLRDQPLTAEQASARGERWTEDDDRYVLEHLRRPAREVALVLGRTLWAVRNRRVHLTRARSARLEAVPGPA